MTNPGAGLAAGKAVRVPVRELELYFLRNFLDAETCARLIEKVDARRRPSTIADDLVYPAFQTSETGELDCADPLVAFLDRKLRALVGIDPALGEPLQGQRYASGHEFKPHTDTFEPGQHDYCLHCADSGNRSWTVMIYLNDVEEGGATRFKAIGKTIQPERGKFVAWNNLQLDGRPNPATLYQGMKVRHGVKYILTKWLHELQNALDGSR